MKINLLEFAEEPVFECVFAHPVMFFIRFG